MYATNGNIIDFEELQAMGVVREGGLMVKSPTQSVPVEAAHGDSGVRDCLVWLLEFPRLVHRSKLQFDDDTSRGWTYAAFAVPIKCN